MKALALVRSHWKWALAGAVALAGLLVIVTTSAGSVDGPTQAERPVFDVQRGPLTISVGVIGSVKPLEQEIIKSEVEGQAAIIYIIPEGTTVKEGDLLVELDSSQIQDQMVDQEIKTQNAEAAFIDSRESFEVVKNQSESDVSKAELTYRFAQEDRQKFIDGDFPLQLKQAQAKLTVAESDLKRSQNKLEGTRRLAERQFVTQMELEADEQAAAKMQLDVQMAEEQMKLLQDFEYKRTLAQLESDEDQARMALERVRRKAAADVVQAEANLKAKEWAFQREQDKLQKLKEQLVKTKMYAPQPGLVVYATTGRGGGFRGNTEPLAEGQTVRERQELIYLPTTDAYKAEVKVHESSLAKVRPKLPVTLVVDALPGRTFSGRVEFISPLPDAQSVWLNPDLKVYNTDIHIEGDTKGLRTGMSCRGEILVQELEDAVYVPVQAVVRESGQPTVYVADGPKVERRKVALGLDNNRMVQIADGLKPGETVLLAPPLGADEMQKKAKPEGEDGEDGAAPPPPGGDPAAAPAPLPPAVDAPAEAAPAPGATESSQGEGGDAGDMRERFQNASPEERARMREEFQKRMESMTPEEREQMRERMGRGGRGQRRGGGEPE